jgi:hypothetical protein
LSKGGDGQADGTLAVSIKGGLELSSPMYTVSVAEFRGGLQSALASRTGERPKSTFSEWKLIEVKGTPLSTWGASGKLDLSFSYKGQKQATP